MLPLPFTSVAVLMGGPSSEREVSLRSGANVAAALREAGIPDVHEVVVAPDATYSLPPSIQAAFIALHGRFGEDGTIQAQLRAAGIPHTGSSPEASALAFDKSRAKPVLAAAGVPTAPFQILTSPSAPVTLPLPLVIKPTRQGSSVGVTRVFDPDQLPAALSTAFALDRVILAEAFIPGRELTVGIVGDTVLPVLEICAPNDTYDYATKYAPASAGGATHLVPAPLPPPVYQRCQDIALQTFRALGCSGMGRVDIRLTPDGAPFVLELNNIPGLTSLSLLPDMARAHGWSYPELCLRILSLASL